MIIRIKKVLFPTKEKTSSNGFTILKVNWVSSETSDPIEMNTDIFDYKNTSFSITGYYLPQSSDLAYSVQGVWQNGKYGPTLEVSSMNEIVEETETGIIAYLTSGLIKGVGPKTANKIYKAFGNETLKVLDENPEKLSIVKGLTEKKIKTIIDSYQEHRGAQEIVTKLAPFGISANKSVKIYRTFGKSAYDDIIKNPYCICKVRGISFLESDYIAKKIGFDMNSHLRYESAIKYILGYNELNGHLFEDMNSLRIKVFSTLNIDFNGTANDIFKISIKNLSDDGDIFVKKHPQTNQIIVYLREAFLAENEVASKVIEIMRETKNISKIDVSKYIEDLEIDRGLLLADKQREAVETCLNNQFSVLTGGPGTGKTTIIDFITSIFLKENPSSTILLCAPTGKAARRMSESTGMSAYTIHKVLNISIDEDKASSRYSDATQISADMLIVDEVSMMDIYLADILTRFTDASKTKVVFIGDVDQLPSVGPGAVLYELIQSNVVPVVRLSQVYRQSNGSKIPTNAALINNGSWSLDYDDSFKFIPVDTFEEAADLMIKNYMSEVEEKGIDNVIMLTPLRKKTATCVDLLNAKIHDFVNPSTGSDEIKIGDTTFRVGDRIMQMKNTAHVSNGDTGEILSIKNSKEGVSISIDFGDDKTLEYDTNDMQNVDLAYVTTIHKSQGSEYKVVILNLMEGHTIMLKRNLLYTAVTRAKQKVIIIGQKKAIITAVQRSFTEKDKRNTLLAERLKYYALH